MNAAPTPPYVDYVAGCPAPSGGFYKTREDGTPIRFTTNRAIRRAEARLAKAKGDR